METWLPPRLINPFTSNASEAAFMTKKKSVDNPSAKELLEGIKGMEILQGLLNYMPGATEAFPDMES
jgi:hypothetical protein